MIKKIKVGKKRVKYEYKGKMMTIRELSQEPECIIPQSTVASRLQKHHAGIIQYNDIYDLLTRIPVTSVRKRMLIASKNKTNLDIDERKQFVDVLKMIGGFPV